MNRILAQTEEIFLNVNDFENFRSAPKRQLASFNVDTEAVVVVVDIVGVGVVTTLKATKMTTQRRA